MKYNFIDMVNKKFGRLTVLKRGDNYRGRVRWFCKMRLRERGLS